ncbi:FliO/MopB family protein [Microterricola viridarii]|uniref:Flagellar protein FliO/FliZ n=1 Tax=Microterricola viridarii TaxID=412690 RepID=A0A1H1W283_9MICO|nr:flagellar biosynthetic protein FliO [Microterricola viridarii]SDS91227.1 flagellar protein FliO/FliZ [Microterricola viridarii]
MDTLFVALRVLLSLGAVLALLWLLQRRFARGGAAKGKARTASLAVVGRQSVGAKASVVVVEHDGQRFLLGVTEHGVTKLHAAPIVPAALPASPTPPASPTETADADQGDAHFARVLAEAGQAEDLVPAAGVPAGTAPAAPVPAAAALSAAVPAAPALARPAGRLAGSILAPETWKQAAAVVRDRW